MICSQPVRTRLALITPAVEQLPVQNPPIKSRSRGRREGETVGEQEESHVKVTKSLQALSSCITQSINLCYLLKYMTVV